jgi:hypothetical protein
MHSYWQERFGEAEYKRFVRMSIDLGVWGIDSMPERVHFSSIATEAKFGRRGCSVVEAIGAHNG